VVLTPRFVAFTERWTSAAGMQGEQRTLVPVRTPGQGFQQIRILYMKGIFDGNTRTES
jgi:hypothetical protein